MTLIKIFYHIIHFFGIGKFYKYKLIISNFDNFTNKAYIISGFSFRKNVEKSIRKSVYMHYGRFALYLNYDYEILEVY